MNCPKCYADNRETRKFCGQCGAKLVLVCPRCGFENLPEEKFCGECGQDLRSAAKAVPKDLSFDEKLAKIQRYLPKGLTEKILSQRERIEGEKKQVTVMFCDMEGYTALSEKLGPEAIYGLMDEVYEILIHKVHDYEGTVNELTGDGVMALFGAPIALEDAPQRAIRSALAIHKEITRFNEKKGFKAQGAGYRAQGQTWGNGQLPEEGNGRVGGSPTSPIRMRIGVHSGPVVLGTVGNDLRVEFKALGDTVNLASRMQTLAEPGTVYVTEDTFKLTEGLFRFEALGERQVKGKEAPVRVYQVIAPSTRRTRFDVSAERGLTPFVGRGRELELLLEAWERAKEGRGQAVSVVADAGLGKSRLLYEFRKAVSNEDLIFLEGKCLSYGRDVAYHPVVDLFRGYFNIIDSDDDTSVRVKVANGMKAAGADQESLIAHTLELLSVQESGIDKATVGPEARKDKTIEALRRIVLKGAGSRPMIVAVEDLHWIDQSSEDVLKYLLDGISGARVLLLFTYRPEFVHAWGGRSYHNQITLNRLSNRESLAMAAHILGSTELDREVGDLILGKTEGVPFFIEEFARSLKDLQLVELADGRVRPCKDLEAIRTPSTIQDTIMARVDAVPEAAKRLLQTASAIEREFPYKLLQRVAKIPDQELVSQLSALKNSELLYERGIHPESTFIFKHALTREVVYDSVLGARRERLHEQIGNALEEVHEGRLEEHSEILADHFMRGGSFQKAAQYYRMAARKAEKAGALSDAIPHCERRVTCLEKLPRTDELLTEIIDARTGLGLYRFQLFYFTEAKEAIDPIKEDALRIKYTKRIAHIHAILGAYYLWVDEDFPQAFEHLQNAHRIGQEVSDIPAMFFSSQWLGFAFAFCCEFEKAMHFFQNALSINISSENVWGASVVKGTISGRVQNVEGNVRIGYAASEEALQIARESGDTYSMAIAHHHHGFSCLLNGSLEQAEGLLLEGVALCERIRFFALLASAHSNLGHLYLEHGRYREAVSHYERAAQSLQLSRMLPSQAGSNDIALCLAKLKAGEEKIDIETAFECVAQNRLKFQEGWIHRLVAEMLMVKEDLARAEEYIAKAVDLDRRNGTMWSLARDYLTQAEIVLQRGEPGKAKEALHLAVEVFGECGADGWRQRAEERLAAIP